MSTRVVETGAFIDEAAIGEALGAASTKDAGRVREVLAKARELKGLDMDDVAILSSVSDPELLGELFAAARDVKEAIYGQRLVLFAPLYISNLCSNECLYCAFRARNKELKRRALTQEEIAPRDRAARRPGPQAHPARGRRVLSQAGLRLRARVDRDDLRRQARQRRDPPRQRQHRAALASRTSRRLKATGIGTYQLFQETYHRDTYAAVHLGGKKTDYDWRVTAMDRAMEAGIDDVGIGVLFGLYDWRFEILALHAAHPRTSSAHFGVRAAHDQRAAPRAGRAAPTWRATRRSRSPTSTSARSSPSCAWPCPTPASSCPPARRAKMRRETFALGVSQISAGSRTNPGGYAEDEKFDAAPVPARRPPLARRGRPRRRRARATCRRSAPPATASAAPARTSWTSPSPARSSITATPTRCRPSRSTCSTTARERHARVGEKLIEQRVREMDDVRRAHTPEDAGQGARRRARRALLSTGRARRANDQWRRQGRERRPHHPRHPHQRPAQERGGRAEGLHRVRLQHQDAHRPARRRRAQLLAERRGAHRVLRLQRTRPRR